MGFVSAAMGLVSLYGASKQASAAKQAARAQAGTEQRMTEEKLYQSEQEERQLAGTTRATAAGSGVKADTGSPLTILAEQAKTFARDRAYVSEVGASKVESTLQRGKNVASAAMFSGITSALGSFGAAGTSMAANKGQGAVKSIFGFGT